METIQYSVSEGVAHIRFNRPEGANAVNPTFAADLRAAMLEAAYDDAVRSVAVTAEGKVFCAGGDLKFFNDCGDALPQTAADMLVDFHGAIYLMNSMEKVVVASVGGAAGGAGLSIVSSFDLVVASENAKFTMAYTRAAMTPDGTSTYFLGRHIGLRRALDLTLTNRVLTADEAEAWGLVNRVVPKGEADQAALDLAAQMAAGASSALGKAKRLIYEGFDSALPEAGEREGMAITAAMASANGKEGIAAFVEKREPNFG
ncbi:MAG: enoyl-CoA hydratase-related protein [Acidimicrobiales bacterium]|nr:enoyl-CoA hydratase/isomerase family protein [Acidimicrobiales bacterium]